MSRLRDSGGDTPLGVGLVLLVPGMPNHPALPNDSIRTGYPHAFKHQPVKSKYIKHQQQETDVGCSTTPSTNDYWEFWSGWFFFEDVASVFSGLPTPKGEKASPFPHRHVNMGKKDVTLPTLRIC